MCDDLKSQYGVGTCILFTVISVVLLAMSFSAVDETQLAILQSRQFGFVINKENEEVFETGNHFIGIWGALQKISKIQQTETFSIVANTKNVMSVDVNISIQYQIKSDYTSLYGVIYNHNNVYEDLQYSMFDAVRRGCQSIQSDTFFNNRILVTNSIRSEVLKAMNSLGYQLVNVQVTNFSFEERLNDAIKNLADATQDIDVAQNERNKETITAKNEKAKRVHDASVDALVSNEIALADFNYEKDIVDAMLYAKRQNIRMISDLIQTYKAQFSTANDGQIMEMMKQDRYINMMGKVAISGSNKIFIDHKPGAIGVISDTLTSRLMS